MWAEARGYTTILGASQVHGFSRWIHSGRPEPAGAAGKMPDYLVLGPDAAVVHEFEGKWGVTAAPALLMKCGNCGSFGFLARGGDESCKALCTNGQAAGSDMKWALGIERGVIRIDGKAFREWLRVADCEGIVPSLTDLN
jgi:hypothetical protein